MPGLSRRLHEILDSIARLDRLTSAFWRNDRSCQLKRRRVSPAWLFSSRSRADRRCPRIFLAHHADDLVETALLNLFRGAGPAGMAAMRRISVHRIGKTQLTILRPLLGVWRKRIDAYVREHGLQFREDATNAPLVLAKQGPSPHPAGYRKTIWP